MFEFEARIVWGARATNGNGVGKGKGKKGKRDHVPQAMLSELNIATDPAEEIREEVRAVIPEAALLCSQSSLIQDERDVPIFPFQPLTKQDGVALVPRRELADVIKRVGFTAQRAAMLLTERPEKLGLAGYRKEHMRVRLLALNEDGEKGGDFCATLLGTTWLW